jgi:hypothetical protein
MDLFEVIHNDNIVYVSGVMLAGGYYFGWRLCKHNPTSNSIAAVPSLLTSGGVLFTFFGIAIGLIDFNPNDLNNSISTLLGGLKLAFWSSIFGMALSMLFKIIEMPKYQKALSQVTPDEMQQVLCSQLSESKAHHQSSQKLLSELAKRLLIARA